MPVSEKHQIICDLYRYSESREVLRLLEGVSSKLVSDLATNIGEQVGTPSNPVNWKDPDAWIPERLKGAQAELAQRLWRDSNKSVNPRYMDTTILDKYGLWRTAGGEHQVTDVGKRFLASDAPLLREIDERERVLDVLDLLAGMPRARISSLLPKWTEILREHTTLQSENTIWTALRCRLLNLIDRGFVVQDGRPYDITEAGRKYLEGSAIDKSIQHVFRAVEKYNREQRQKLIDQLIRMDPIDFEKLVMELLGKMGYIDMEVTSSTNDKGVDVIGMINFGISQVKEVVQVKRTRSSVGRPVLDQLRGSLVYFGAIRGSIFTLGTFPKSCQESALLTNAAPITLVDGEMLLDLLFENQVGVKSREVAIYELDDEFFDKYKSQAKQIG